VSLLDLAFDRIIALLFETRPMSQIWPRLPLSSAPDICYSAPVRQPDLSIASGVEDRRAGP
jgi:hypothetical protein